MLLHLRPIVTDAWHGVIYRDHFYEPYASWYPELPRGAYVAVLWVAVLAAVAMTIGLATRVATATVAVIVTYDLFLSTTNFHNNRAYLVIVLAALAVAPCGRELSVDAWLRRRRGRPPLPTTSPGWPLWLLRVEAATVYGASGLSKLLDPDWFDGTVTWQRLNAVRSQLDASVLPGWAVDLLTNRAFNTVSAKFVIATELFIAIGLWSRRTRYAAIWVAICFHVAIQLSADVEVFSYLALRRARDLGRAVDARPRAGHRSRQPRPPARRHGDGRTRLAGPLPCRGRAPGAPLTVVDRDGSVVAGGAGRVRRQPTAGDGVVRPADARDARRPPTGPAMTAPRRRVLFGATGLVVAAVVTFGALAPPERCPQPTVESLDSAADAAVRWFVDNQRPDGTWLYQYDRATDSEVTSEPYNLVRHAGGVMGLYQAATAGIAGALESADRGVDVGSRPPRRPRRLDRPRRRDHGAGRWGRPADGGPRGAAAAHRRHARRRADARPRPLHGRDDAARRRRHLPLRRRRRWRPIADSRSKYYTGEAYWALARLHRLFPDDGFGEVADRIGNYLATRRDDVEDHWPPVPDHWAAYALAETVQFPERDRRHPLTDAELDYARSQAGSFGAQVRWVSQQAGPWGVAVRGTHVPRGGGYGVVGEALTGFWRVAEADDRLADLRGPLADRAECIAGLAIDRQVRDGPVAVAGAWFIGDVTRMDDQQHATSALLRTTSIVDSTPSPGHPAPSAWLWAVALLALLDPLAIGMAVPARARRSRPRDARRGRRGDRRRAGRRRGARRRAALRRHRRQPAGRPPRRRPGRRRHRDRPAVPAGAAPAGGPRRLARRARCRWRSR